MDPLAYYVSSKDCTSATETMLVTPHLHVALHQLRASQGAIHHGLQQGHNSLALHDQSFKKMGVSELHKPHVRRKATEAPTS